MEIPEGLRSTPRVIYQNNPLKVVVLQVRFSPILLLAQPAGLAPLQEAIRSDYPQAAAPEQQVSVSIAPNGTVSPMAQMGPWRFLSEDGNWTVSVAPDFVALETKAYSRYEDFDTRARALFEVVPRVLQLRDRGRLGLRYVNEINYPEAATLAQWDELLDPELLGICGRELKERIVRTIQHIDVNIDDGILTIRHGCDTSNEGASPYVIDLDAHDDESRPYTVDDIMRRAAGYREWIGGFFRKSLRPKLAEYLHPMEIEGEN